MHDLTPQTLSTVNSCLCWSRPRAALDGYRSPFRHALFRQAPFRHSPFRHAPVSLTLILTLPVPHVDLGAGLLQYADNRPTIIITLVGMVAVGMVRVGMMGVRMMGVGMVPAPRPWQRLPAPSLQPQTSSFIVILAVTGLTNTTYQCGWSWFSGHWSRLWNSLSLHLLRLLLFSKSGSKLNFSLVHRHSNSHATYQCTIQWFSSFLFRPL